MDQRATSTTGEATRETLQAELGLDHKGRSRRGRGWLIALAALVVVGGAAGYYLLGSSSTATVHYRTVTAETGDLTVEVTATGTLEPLTQVDISSELSGVVRAVAVEENQYVKKGAVLAELDTTRLLAEIERAEASVKAAQAKVKDAETTLKETTTAYERAAQLTQRGMATTQSLEAAEAARDRAQAALDAAEANAAITIAELKLQQADLQKSTIYAPIDGIILTRDVDPGQTVASSLQAPVLFVIAADLRKMELLAAVDEADIGGVQAGQKARFTVDAFPGRTFTANIRDIAYASVTTDGVVTYDARLEVDNSELLLRPGMTATVEIITREATDVLMVPSAAFRFRPSVVEQGSRWRLDRLFQPPRMFNRNTSTNVQRTDGSRALYVLKNGAPEQIHVKTGATDADRTEITSGLSAGDNVIIGTATSAQYSTSGRSSQ